MKKYFTLISDLADKYIHPSITISSVKRSGFSNRDYELPSVYYAKKSLIMISSCFNSFSAYYKSPLLLNRVLEYLNQAAKYADKGSYEPASFCLSIMNISYVYRLAKTYTKILSPCDRHMGNDIQKAALDYLETAKITAANLKEDTVYKYAALLHCVKDLKDDQLKQYTDEIKDSVQDTGLLSNQQIHTLCDIYRENKDKKYLKAAQNNMISVLKLIEPDDSVVNLADELDNLKKRNAPLYLQDYLGSLIYLTSVLKNEDFDKALSYTLKALAIDENPDTDDNDSLLLIPALVLLNRGFLDIEVFEITRTEALSVFNGFIDGDKTYRHGTGTHVSQTVYKEQDTFYSMQCGALKLRLRFNATFFGPKGRFKSEVIEKTEKTLKLHYSRQWGYFLPLEDRSIPPIIGSDVNKNDRKMTNLQNIDIDVSINFLDNGADITLTASKIDDLACKLDFIFDKHGFFDSDYASIQAVGNDFIQLQEGSFTYTLGSDYITAGPAFNGSSISSETLRGSNLPIEDTFTVYFTDMTPANHTVQIRGGRT